MSKKSSMQEEVEETEAGEQLDLIDIAPKNAKVIIEAARIYKRLLATRQKALVKEVAQKAEVLRLVREAELTPLEGGKIRFRYDGFLISVTPRDELIKVIEETEE